MVILITGASRGIGREIAITLSKEGHKIIANYNKSEEQAKELEKQNTNIEIFKADVSKRNEVQNMVQEIIKKYGKIDVLINNAGISENKLFTNVTDEDNIDWTEISTTDVYTGDDFSAVFVEADDGSVAIANSDFSLVMEGQYLTADEAIAYMGAAANYIN